MLGDEGTLLASAAGKSYGAIRAAVSAGVSSRPTISRSKVFDYASSLRVADDVNERSIAPITCSERSLLSCPLSASVKSTK